MFIRKVLYCIENKLKFLGAQSGYTYDPRSTYYQQAAAYNANVQAGPIQPKVFSCFFFYYFI